MHCHGWDSSLHRIVITSIVVFQCHWTEDDISSSISIVDSDLSPTAAPIFSSIPIPFSVSAELLTLDSQFLLLSYCSGCWVAWYRSRPRPCLPASEQRVKQRVIKVRIWAISDNTGRRALPVTTRHFTSNGRLYCKSEQLDEANAHLVWRPLGCLGLLCWTWGQMQLLVLFHQLQASGQFGQASSLKVYWSVVFSLYQVLNQAIHSILRMSPWSRALSASWFFSLELFDDSSTFISSLCLSLVFVASVALWTRSLERRVPSRSTRFPRVAKVASNLSEQHWLHINLIIMAFL